MNAGTQQNGRKGPAAPNHSGDRGRAHRRWAVVCAMFFALLWQSLAAQTHRHLDLLTPAQVAHSVNGAGDSGPGTPLDSPLDCSFCRELAHAGPLLLPAGISVAAPIAAAFRISATRLRELVLIARAPLWRSRAPPLSLQA